MRNTIYSLAICMVLIGLTGCNNKKSEALTVTDPMTLFGQIDWKAKANTLTETEQSAGWQLLFDGSTGNGWHGYNQKGIPECWAVEDACLTMKSVGGNEEQDLITNKVYKKFVLALDYKMTPGANSGILFHIKEDPKYTFAYETGPEFQVIDHENWPDPLEDVQINGGNYAMYPPMERPYKPIGEWNQLMLVVNGNEVTHILNGKIIVKYTKYSDEWTKLRNSGKWNAFPDYSKYDEGHISLQNHGTKVWYRNIKLKEL
ncbi:hypothetical protein M2459_001886 [Parabacteroides sp. PF5-5]|uniref:3-keto-disaccharide hydrolase n=1 Tax=unclassified Parabacteroides TaxID=2649774 RepID=UPI0024734E45|nr:MULTISPECIES: DUF1080 domain-containing protein [unclassified Parabacteroides]MDH6305433.1 hypothetical protein [Parabacteroides sp. PH5-39]MDH6316143.1 hypothetical protein [Parabacteroides sp. PF5-13]MDH6320293.1 hypothetical protein [Parabacteroides sp. PH5-13]MDH6324023.1 hypothetical protein [Parabacteroides sp. PH5-8]MDH6327334.1 hypothetical protein [Parabacteroides sp. PH5-41]